MATAKAATAKAATADDEDLETRAKAKAAALESDETFNDIHELLEEPVEESVSEDRKK